MNALNEEASPHGKGVEDIFIGLMDPNHFALKETLFQLINELDLVISYEGRALRIRAGMLRSRPYDLRRPPAPYRVVLNRGAHWNPHFHAYLSLLEPDLYLVNDMGSFFAVNKNTAYGQMSRLGLNIPPTAALPQADYSRLQADPRIHPEIMFADIEGFDLEEVAKWVGFPAYLKPQSGGGWHGVVRVENMKELVNAYRASGDEPMNLQRAVDYREFVRSVGVGPQVLAMHYNPRAPLSHERHLRGPDRAVEHDFLSADEYESVAQITRIINAFYNWDHNSCEILLDTQGRFSPIDFANACPDSSPVSVHYYFPDLVKALARWLIFVAVSARRKPCYKAIWPTFISCAEALDRDRADGAERRRALDAIARAHFDADRFDAFCHEKLPDFDQRCHTFFADDRFFDILAREVRLYFQSPAEAEAQLEHYMGIHRFWLHCDKGRGK